MKVMFGLALLFFVVSVRGELRSDGYHVLPGEEIQKYLDAAAINTLQKHVIVHAGTYAPSGKRQALIWLNQRHDGIRLEADGNVTLTAQNRDLAGHSSSNNSAMVNHVIYVGHLVGSNTLIKGFRVTGANAFCTKGATKRFEPDESVLKNLFFFTDGGAIKVFGQSSPVFSDLIIENNFASPCAGGISIQQQGLTNQPVVIRRSIFRGNKAQVTGAALDLLGGSAAEVQNCLFLENASNLGDDVVAKISKEKPFTNSGVVTVFEASSLIMRNCTFTGNRNAIDERGGRSVIENCVFYKNNLQTGLPANRYEVELTTGTQMTGCEINGVVRFRSLPSEITEKILHADDPKFDALWRPENPAYGAIGYRPNR